MMVWVKKQTGFWVWQKIVQDHEKFSREKRALFWSACGLLLETTGQREHPATPKTPDSSGPIPQHPFNSAGTVRILVLPLRICSITSKRCLSPRSHLHPGFPHLVSRVNRLLRSIHALIATLPPPYHFAPKKKFSLGLFVLMRIKIH